MKFYVEEPLTNFTFWSGAKDTVKYLTYKELQEIEIILEELYPDGVDEVTIHDFFWFEEDTIAQWLGYDNFDEIMERNND